MLFIVVVHFHSSTYIYLKVDKYTLGRNGSIFKVPLKNYNGLFILFSDSTNSNIISEERITNSSYSSVENNNRLVTSSESVSAKDLSIPKIESAVTNIASTGKHIQQCGASSA